MTRRVAAAVLMACGLGFTGCAATSPTAATDWNFHSIALDPAPMARTVSDGSADAVDLTDWHNVSRWDLPWRPPAQMAEEEGDEGGNADTGDAGGAAE